ncbi:small-conductance mechanosensitive channel [Xenococcus sp. PCC 7305]|uniref:mechanosensitive ion channel family protein n=1 Tax=Xenococcus sp. PCC 7305 TaxID=102125 RepID=UPI0002AC594E|nr:mechanosensitive ion channel family protein [Xenococcus sp. PCC 7305]ELS01899.1 small-conductance mechanosensitive channel [Xenococcus sp. PCC 7305]
MRENWLFWSFISAILFPLLMILLGEITLNLERKQNRIANLIKILRNLIIPFSALFVIQFKLLQLPKNSIFLRFTETFLWIILIYFGLTLINQILFEDAQQGTWRSNVPKLLLDLSRTFLVLIGAAVVLSNVWDANLGRLLTALGVGSLVIGLALQDSLGNIFSGVTLLLEKPIKIGDWIELGDIQGQVYEITWRSVHIYTRQRDLVIVPNSELAKGSFRNYSSPEPIHGVEVEIKFSCNDTPNRVIEVLRKTVLDTKGVLREPPPKVRLTSLDDWFLMYKTTFFVKDYVQGIESRHEFQLRMWYSSQRYNLTMPYPTTLEYQSSIPIADEYPQKALDILKQVPGWDSLAPNVLSEVLKYSIFENYAQEEVIVKEEQLLRGLFIVLEGKVALSFINSFGQTKIVGHILPGEIFGEKSCLLSGQRSDVTATSLVDTELVIIPIELLQSKIKQFPLLANKLGEIMELRRQLIVSLS